MENKFNSLKLLIEEHKKENYALLNSIEILEERVKFLEKVVFDLVNTLNKEQKNDYLRSFKK